jgi:hypothetical protein
MKRVLTYQGHKLLDDGNAPEVYAAVNGCDILDDVAKAAESAEKSGRGAGAIINAQLGSKIYVALRKNYADSLAEQNQKDPDVDGKTVKDFRDELNFHDFISAEFIELVKSTIAGKKEETAETPTPEEASPAPSSTPSPSPKEG